MPYIQSRTVSDGEEGIRVEKCIYRPCTLQITPINNSGEKIKSVEMLHHFNNIINIPIDGLIKCFQSNGENTFLATFRDEQSKELFQGVITEQFSIGEQKYQLSEATPLSWENKKPNIEIKLFGVPYEIKPEYIRQKLDKYVDIENFKYTTYSDFPDIESGVQIVTANCIKQDIPRKIYVKGQPISVRYEGQPSGRLCFNCREYGHISKDCPEQRGGTWGLSARTRPITQSQTSLCSSQETIRTEGETTPKTIDDTANESQTQTIEMTPEEIPENINTITIDKTNEEQIVIIDHVDSSTNEKHTEKEQNKKCSEEAKSKKDETEIPNFYDLAIDIPSMLSPLPDEAEKNTNKETKKTTKSKEKEKQTTEEKRSKSTGRLSTGKPKQSGASVAQGHENKNKNKNTTEEKQRGSVSQNKEKERNEKRKNRSDSDSTEKAHPQKKQSFV